MEAAIFPEMAEIQERHWWFAARREILASVISRLPLPSSPPEILEIGCGTRGNLSMLRRFGSVQAMEMDEFAHDEAQRVGEIPVQPGSLPSPVPFPPRSFDLICLFDVLEHVEDDRAALAAAGQLARQEGRLLITVPAYAWLFGAHDRAHHHWRRYTAGGISQLAQSAGLSIERIGYFNTLLFPRIAARRLADKRSRNASTSDAALPSAFVNRVLKSVFAAEAPLIARMFLPFGTSVIAVLTPGSKEAAR